MGRRANGEGSLRQKPDGRWEGAVQLSGRRYWVNGRTQAEARKKLKELGRRHTIGELTPPTRLTLGDFLDQWLETNKDDWKPKTLEGYRSLIANYWGEQLGHIRLQRLTAPLIASCYTRWASERNVTGGTLLNVHRCLHRALRVAVLWGYLPNNPADRVEPPKARRKRPKLRVAELSRYRRNSRAENAVRALGASAMGERPSEA